MRNVHNFLVGKTEWERPLGRPGHRWESRLNIRIDWIQLA
jgi:hypothetical protein